MGQETQREAIFEKWREAKDAGLWLKCENCSRDLLSTLDESLDEKLNLERFYNQLNDEVKKENALLHAIQNNAPPLKREYYNPFYEDVNRWAVNELYNAFYKVFLKNSFIKTER